MRAGKLRHRVTIEQPYETQDGSGGVVTTWEEVATVSASVEPLRGDERFGAQQVSAEISTRVRMRYRDGVQPKQRLTFGERVLEVEAVIDVAGRGRELELICKEAA